MLDLQTIGQRIADLRKAQGMTQNDLASKLFVTHQAVSKWEQGKSAPTIDILYALTQLFSISIDALIADSDIAEDDYDRLFLIHPTAVVLAKFLQSETQIDDLDKVFYRLKQSQRLQVIHQIIRGRGDLKVDHIWPYLNNAERTYLLAPFSAVPWTTISRQFRPNSPPPSKASFVPSTKTAPIPTRFITGFTPTNLRRTQ